MNQSIEQGRFNSRQGDTNFNLNVQSKDFKQKKINTQEYISFGDVSTKSIVEQNKSSIEQIMAYFNNYIPQSDFQIDQLKNSQHLKLKKYDNYTYFGEIVNGMRHGKGITLYNTGRLYQGNWQKDLKNGKGFQKFANNSRYNGYYINGKPEGYGTFVWPNGQVYQGQWLNGLKHGSGMWKGQRGDSYIGEWKFGKADGCGVHTWINGDRYEGQFKQCLKNGQGTQKFINGDMYTGSYVKGKPQGYGQYIWANKSYFKGEFKNGFRNGKGVWKKKTGNSDKYQGQYVNDKKSGYGIFTWKNGNVYKGEFLNDLRHGYGEMYWSDGSTYKGHWKNGIQHGEGQIRFKDEKAKKGFFQQNVLVKLIPQNHQNRENLNATSPHIHNKKMNSQLSETLNTKQEPDKPIFNNKTQSRNFQDEFQSFDQDLPKKLYKPLFNLRSKKVYMKQQTKIPKTTNIQQKQKQQKLQILHTNNNTIQLKQVKSPKRKSTLPSYFYYNEDKIERPSATIHIVSHLTNSKKRKKSQYQKTDITQQHQFRKKLNMSLTEKPQSNFRKTPKSPRLNVYF